MRKLKQYHLPTPIRCESCNAASAKENEVRYRVYQEVDLCDRCYRELLKNPVVSVGEEE